MARYDNWLALGFALSDIFNEEGRQIYHDLSRQNGQYNPKECDAQYTKCLGGKRSGVTYRTFFALAEKAGIDLKMYPKSHPKFEGFAPVSEEMARGVNSKKGGVSAISAKAPSDPNIEKIGKKPFFDFFEKEEPYGTMALMALTSGKTFSDKIDLSDWPGFCREVIEGQVEAIDKDKMILGTLNIISGVLPSSLYSLYDGRRIFAPMYNILYGGFATKKGDLEACRQLVTPLKHEMRIFTHPLIPS